MFGNNKKVSTLAEDFRSLGLIRGEPQAESKPALTENADPKREALRRKMMEQKRQAARGKMIEQKKREDARKKMIESKRELLRKKLIEAKRAALLKAKSATGVKKESVSNSLRNLVSLEKRLQTTTAIGDLVKAFENVQKVSRLAFHRFKKLSEADADSGQEVKPNTNDNTNKPQAGKVIPPGYSDMTDGKDHEGNVGVDSDDSQEGNVAKTKEVDTVTGKYAGKDQTTPAVEVDIVENDDMDIDDEDLLSTEDDELPPAATEGEDMDSDDGFPGNDNHAEPDDEDDLTTESDDMDADDAFPGEDLETEDDELPPAPAPAVPAAEGEELSSPDDITDEELDAIEAELGDELSTEDSEMGDELPPENEDEDPAAAVPSTMAPKSVESKRMPKKAYMSELKDIYKEAEDIMARIRKHAVTPADAEAVLKDVVMRLGGAVGDLADMGQYNGSDKAVNVESKKKGKK